MAALSPAISNNSTDTNVSAVTATGAASNAAVSSFRHTTTNASRNLRGLNKPKCIKCGNVARSRCPYQSCKSCCAKAQNPCHIHVLKGSSSLPEKGSSAGSPALDQQSTEPSPSGTSLRVANYRQLSSNFAQFNNLQTPPRSKKPLTRKDAAAINEWRFSKLKEFKECNIELENEAFDRYMQNVKLLEEVFSENPSTKGRVPNHSGALISRKRVEEIVESGLKKIKKIEASFEKSSRAEKTAALTELMDKLNKARNEEDLKACAEMKAEIYNKKVEESEGKVEDARGKIGILQPGSEGDYSILKWVSTNVVDEEEVNMMNERFSSLRDVENL